MINKLTLRLTRYHNTDPKKLQSISAKPFFKHYQTAITLSLQNKLKQANEQFTKSLQQIRQTKQKQLQHFPFILRRIAHNYRRLGQMKQAQQKLYEVIKHKRQCGINSVLLYDDYDRLYKHMLSYDLQKAIKLCKAIMLKQKDDMPISHIKLFNLNLANAYLLSGNYMDAKNRYSKCLQADPQGNLKSYAYNNLGLACWWHKNPIQKIRQQLQDDVQRIQKDFTQVKSLFAKSISISQNLTSQISQSRKLLLDQVLDFKKGTLSQKLQFTSTASIYGMHNLAQYYIANDPLQKVQILYWLKKSLNLAKLRNKQKYFDIILVQYLLLTNNIESLIQKLPSLIQKYRYSQQFVQQANFCHILGKILLNNNNNNSNKQQSMKLKSKQYLNRAQQIRGILPHWVWKMKYIAIDQLDLLHQ